MRATCSVLVTFIAASLALGHNILLTNDDGWATAQIRAQNDALEEAGFSVCVSHRSLLRYSP